MLLLTESAAKTVECGEILGRLLEPGDFIAMTGDLGSGKTQFARGVALGLGVAAATAVTSPTFTILNEYSGRIPFYHFDLYRLHGDDDVIELGFDEYFHGRGVCLVEWAERLRVELPEERLILSMSADGETSRRLVLEARGGRYERLLDQLLQIPAILRLCPTVAGATLQGVE